MRLIVGYKHIVAGIYRYPLQRYLLVHMGIRTGNGSLVTPLRIAFRNIDYGTYEAMRDS